MENKSSNYNQRNSENPFENTNTQNIYNNDLKYLIKKLTLTTYTH